jgi:phage-related minor tail protein
MSFGDGGDATDTGNDLSATLDGLQTRTNNLGVSANTLAGALTKAFSQATTGGKQFDDVLKSLALRLSNLAVSAALKPLTKGLSGGLNELFAGLFGGSGVAAQFGAIKPFAAGGVIGTPTYFPLSNGGVGLAGEAGAEAIVPLARGPDGQLGVAMTGAGAPANITVQIATPDVGSFRRSEAYVTGQIARAVARGRRSL